MNDNKKTNKLQKLQARQTATAAIAQKLQKSIGVIKRKQDLQRKILIGSYYLEQAKKNNSTQELQQIMLSQLQRDADKKLFNDL